MVDQAEWAAHAEKWRQSIDTDHGSPDGSGTVARFFDGSEFKALKELVEGEAARVLSVLESL